MALSLEEILGYVPLTKAIETVKAGVPRLLPRAFYARNPQFRLLGDKTRRVETQGTRKNARLVPYGAPSRQVTALPLDGRDIRLLHTEETISFSWELFMQIREFESYTLMMKLAEEARRQIKNIADRQVNLETSLVHSMLANGKLWFNSDGEMQPTSASPDLTIDYGVPANNQNQINGVIDASWALATTNIPLHLKKIRQKARFTSGYPLKYALYGQNVMSYMLQNTFLQSYLVSLGGQSLANQFLSTGELPSGFMGFEWISMNEAFYDTEGGTTTAIWDDDAITFTPDPADTNCYGIYEGSYPVLTKFDLTGDAMGQFGNYEQKYGAYGYGYPSFPPAPLGLFGAVGDTSLPALMNPPAFFFVDTTP